MNQIRPRRKVTRGSNKPGSGVRKTNYRRTENESEVVSGGKNYQKAIQSRDKYRELAREALVSGDRVAAEGYFQHADHYNRIIIAAQELAEERQLDAAKKSADDNISPPDSQLAEVVSVVADAD